jgi:hypothetical protein
LVVGIVARVLVTRIVTDLLAFARDHWKTPFLLLFAIGFLGLAWTVAIPILVRTTIIVGIVVVSVVVVVPVVITIPIGVIIGIVIRGVVGRPCLS